MKTTLKSLWALCLTMLLTSCAQIVTPSGGPKDMAPPKVVKYVPDSAKTFFSSSKITFTFNEFIRLYDINNQLIVSPPLEHKPTFEVNDKSLTIAFNDDEVLKDSSTYLMLFGDAIQDNNEGNILNDFKYVFSTGSYIDSLSVNGQVLNAFTNEPEQGVLVMLYKNNDDSVVFNSMPNYFSKTAEDGSYIINNLKRGAYKIVALKDDNGNFKFDEEELIAFSNTPVEAGKDSSISLSLFEEPVKNVYLKTFKHSAAGKIDFTFNRPDSALAIKVINNNVELGNSLWQWHEDYLNITYWYKNINTDSLWFEISINQEIIDSVGIKLIKPDTLQGKSALILLGSPNKQKQLNLGTECSLLFSTPITGYNSTPPLLYKDSILLQSNKNKFSFVGTNRIQELALVYIKNDSSKGSAYDKVSHDANYNAFTQWDGKTHYKIELLPKSIIDFFGNTNDSITIEFLTQKTEHYGNLSLEIMLPPDSSSYIVQLINSKGDVIREHIIMKSSTLVYDYLNPEKYRVKLIYDINRNGKWDTGDYIKHRQAEKVLFNAEQISIRENWDIDLTWDLR